MLLLEKWCALAILVLMCLTSVTCQDKETQADNAEPEPDNAEPQADNEEPEPDNAETEVDNAEPEMEESSKEAAESDGWSHKIKVDKNNVQTFGWMTDKTITSNVSLTIQYFRCRIKAYQLIVNITSIG